MAKHTLAQYEQILNSLEQSLQEICAQHKLVHHSLTESQTFCSSALINMDETWAKVINLLIKVKHLRLTNFSCESDEY